MSEDDPLTARRPVRVEWEEEHGSGIRRAQHWQLGRALRRVGKLLRHGRVDLLAGGWVSIEWPERRLRVRTITVIDISEEPRDGQSASSE